MTWILVILATASLVALVAVAASGLGPVSSLRRTLARYADLREELDGLRRGLDRLEETARRLRDRT